MILHILIAMVAGWLQRHQQQVITYLQEENRVLKAQLGGRRLRLTDTERRRLAALAHPLGRKRLKEFATLATPDTLLRWYTRLIAQKFDGSHATSPAVAAPVSPRRWSSSSCAWLRKTGRGATAASRGRSRTWGMPSTRSRCGTSCDRHHMEPAPQRRKAGMDWVQFLKLHWEVLAATDFFTVEVATWRGLVTYYQDDGKDSSQKLTDVSYRRAARPCRPSQVVATSRARSTHRHPTDIMGTGVFTKPFAGY